MTPSDDVVRAAIAGDFKARKTIAAWLLVELSDFFAKRFHGSNRVSDLVQSTMVRVWAELADQTPSDTHEFRQWCLDLARRTAGATGRKARRDRKRAAKLAAADVEPSTSISSMLADAEQRKLVERCLEKLATPYREVLRDKMSGGSARSFADATGIPINTIYTRRRQAEKQLKELITRERATPPPPMQ